MNINKSAYLITMLLINLCAIQALGQEFEIIQSSTVCDRRGCYEPSDNGPADELGARELFRRVPMNRRFVMSDVDSRRVDAVELAIASDLCERQRSLVERASETEGLFTLLGVQSIEPEGVGAASVAAEILGDDGFTVTIELEKGAHVAGSEGERVFLHHRAGDFGGVETHIVSVDEINERCGR